MRFFARRAWYEVQVMVSSVYPGHGYTYRGAFNGTLRDCRAYTEESSMQGIGYRVVRTKVVAERDGSVGHDELRHLFTVQAFMRAARVLEQMADQDAGHDDE